MSDLIILHTADLHIGKNRKYGDYLEQQTYMLQGILDVCKQTLTANPESKIWLIVAGDVFDRNEDTLREEFVAFLSEFFLPLLKLQEKEERFTWYMIDGNHDRQANYEHPSVLSPLLDLTSQLAVREPKFFPDTKVLLAPFRGYDDEGYRQLLKDFPETQFLVGHECLARMVTDTGWTPPRDQDHYLEIDNVLTSKIAGVFLGDIHKCQSLDKNGLCWYSGSPITLDHGHKLPKGVLKHYFIKVGGAWAQERQPELVPLEDPRIKRHFQLGRLLDPDAVPLAKLMEYHHKDYAQLVVSADVYQKIDGAIPDFFTSPLVTWEFDRTKDAVTTGGDTSVATEVQSMMEYYTPLIEQWVTENSEDLTEAERDAVRKRLFSDFAKRTAET